MIYILMNEFEKKKIEECRGNARKRVNLLAKINLPSKNRKREKKKKLGREKTRKEAKR
jgi:hypothetical protein